MGAYFNAVQALSPVAYWRLGETSGTTAGDWWADATVSVEGGTDEVQSAATGTEGDPHVSVARLFNGAYARIASFVIAG